VYVGATENLTGFHNSGGMGFTGYDVEVSGGRQYARVRIGDVDAAHPGDELYATSDNGGLAEWTTDGVTWTGVGIHNNPANQLLDFQIGDFEPTYAGQEIAMGFEQDMSYYEKSTGGWVGHFIQSFGDVSFPGIGIGNVDPTLSGNQIAYTDWANDASASDIGYFQMGTGGFGIQHTNTDRYGEGVAVGDLDGDGIDEIVVAASGANPVLSIFYWTSTGWAEQALGVWPREFFDVALGDVDGNGGLDIVFGARDYAGALLNPIPEPATMTLLALGGMIALKRRRR
jgi:hypothetical protein